MPSMRLAVMVAILAAIVLGVTLSVPWLNTPVLIALADGLAVTGLIVWIAYVAAGTDVLAQENITETMPLPADLTGDGDLFMLKVRGDSMIEDGILDGDFVVCRAQNTAQKNDVVVAGIPGDEATVKRYFPEKDHIRLQPENKKLSPILVSKRDVVSSGFEVLGVVVGLFRSVSSPRYA